MTALKEENPQATNPRVPNSLHQENSHHTLRLVKASEIPTGSADEMEAYQADYADWCEYINDQIDFGGHFEYPTFEHWRRGGPPVPAPHEESMNVPHPLDAYSGNPTAQAVLDTALNGTPPTWDVEAAQARVREGTIAGRVEEILIEREARRRADDTERPATELPAVKPLDALLAEPDDPVAYRVDRVLLDQARTLLAAQFKAGKTTLRDNLIRSLVDGNDFLGEFAVNRTAKRVAIIDDELSQNMVRRWLREQNITNSAAVADVACLRGKVSTFNVLDDRVRGMWARRFADLGVDYLVLDCLRPVLDALGLDENRDAGKFLVAFDAMLDEAGIGDALLVHHMGHSGERARGDSRLVDWPDATWRLVRENDEPSSPRYFSAYGRDVDVAEGLLDYDPAARHLTYSEMSRTDRGSDMKVHEARARMLHVLANHAKAAAGVGDEVGMSRRKLIELRQTAGGVISERNAQKAIGVLIAEGVVTEYDGPKRARLNKITAPCRHCQLPVNGLDPDAHRTCEGQ